jgi:hypothetical protein
VAEGNVATCNARWKNVALFFFINEGMKVGDKGPVGPNP